MIRRFVAALTLFAAAGCATQTAQPPSVRFKILQINDVYKIEGLEGGQIGGLARVRTLRKLLESDGTPVYVMHGGDALFPSVMSKYLDAKPIIDVMNLLDGDATKFDARMMAGLGNHELDKSDDKILLARLKESQFSWIATNTLYCKAANDCAPFRVLGDPVAEVMQFDAGNLNVGVMGLLYPVSKPYARSTDVILAASEAFEALSRAGARLTIAITHQDMPDDVRLVQALPGLDLVIGGHDHLFTQQQVGLTWIAKADADAKSAIVYVVTVDADGMHTTPLRVVLDSTIAKDPLVDARVQQWMATLTERLGGNETIGTTKNLLEGIEPAVRGRETALGNLLMDAAREQMGTDVAVLNGGSIRINDNIPPGPITKYDMEGVFYYTNTLVAFPVTGQQLLDMLRNSVSRVDAGDGRFLQVSGLRFNYHPRDGKFIVEASDVEVGGKPLDVSATYSMATIDYVYLQGIDDGYTLFTDATRPPKINTEREADFRSTVEKYIRAHGTVTQSIEGRIVRK
ncbi:MAG: 5'-nucleotidase C-terminal domain-containing protein [Acidobacteriota bacterium]|nr:5'-nucleotidase C-terminal domain-containing protein [Acidobacteriota bacterium]